MKRIDGMGRCRHPAWSVYGRKLILGAVLAAGIMYGHGEARGQAQEQEPESAFSARFIGGAYQKGQAPFLGAGLSGRLALKRIRIDAKIDQIYRNFKSAELDHAEFDITIPAGPISVMPFVFRSQYYNGAPLDLGVVFHLTHLNLHVAPQWVYGSNALPVPVFWTPKLLRGKLELLFKVIPILDYALLPKPAPLIGAEFKVSFRLSERIQFYGKVFEMTSRDTHGNMFVRALNAQAGLESEL